MPFLPFLAAATIACTPITVHDADTVRCGQLRVRLAEIDAPEVKGSPRCIARQRAKLAGTRNPPWCDFEAGERAKAALVQFVSRGPVRLQIVGSGAYGRVLGKLTVKRRDAGTYLLQQGVVRRWR